MKTIYTQFRLYTKHTSEAVHGKELETALAVPDYIPLILTREMQSLEEL